MRIDSTEIIAQLFAIAVSIYAFRKKSVSVSGLMSMLIISTTFIWNGGIAALTVLFSMFAGSSVLTKYKQEYKSFLTDKVLKKHGPRDAIQAICNLGVAFCCYILYTFTEEKTYLLALLCSVAASNADSWASEIGVLSKSKPILITNFKTCKPGISGGITLLGTFAGIVGSCFIAAISILLNNSISLNYSAIHLFTLITLSGIAGLLIDSILGATLQVVYKDDQGEETENSTVSQSKSRGLSWINNDFVNFLSSFLVALGIILLPI
jgi:uncharacterized protein (TIGR00297 family)